MTFLEPTLRRVGAVLTTSLTAIAVNAQPSQAQDDVAALAAACASAVTELAGPCLEIALAAQAAQGLIGLSASGGVELPGSPSTLGRRPDAAPPFAGSLRLGLAQAPMPDGLIHASGPAGSRDATGWTLQATGVLGLTNGFAVSPTVAGILSADILGTFSAMALPNEQGFVDSPLGWGLGVRLGVLRESFTLPGITLSLVHRRMGEADLEQSTPAGVGEIHMAVQSTSARATVGKDFAGFGLLGGFGWERYTSDVDLSIWPAGFNSMAATATDQSLVSDRLVFYGGLGYTSVVFQLSLEGGFAEGLSTLDGREELFDPSSGSVFLRVAGRLTRVTF